MNAPDRVHVLNGICPYFTMFPLDFPMGVLCGRAKPGEWVLDPFCGRGTTNLAARLLGLPSVGVDSSPVAAAIAQAKLVNATPEEIVAAAEQILADIPTTGVPTGEFWAAAFDPTVLLTVCRLREALRHGILLDAQVALRAIILGALHGPQGKIKASYFSNQCQRTYAPKPAYAVRFWTRKGLTPRPVDVLQIVEERARRYYGAPLPRADGQVACGDSRFPLALRNGAGASGFRWVITSPPYYGMRTYLPDQWLRLWFVGGPATVEYSNVGQLAHSSPMQFAEQLRTVWRNVYDLCANEGRMVIRFGGIHDRKAEPLELIFESIRDSGWTVERTAPAGSASGGRRQALHFANSSPKPMEEYDIWLSRGGRSPWSCDVRTWILRNSNSSQVNQPTGSRFGCFFSAGA